MASLRPILSVADVDAATAFYCEQLGFDRQFSLQDAHGATFFASVSFEGGSIMLSRQQISDLPAATRRQARADVTLLIALPPTIEIDAFYAELQRKGVTIVGAIADKFWGSREFTLRDPQGYHIAFTQAKRAVSADEARDIAARLDFDPPADA